MRGGPWEKVACLMQVTEAFVPIHQFMLQSGASTC